MIEWKDGVFYFCHPYTCRDENGNYIPGREEANFRLCNIRAAKLIEKGYLVISPISHTHPIHIAYPPFVGKNVHDMWYDFDNRIIAQLPFKGAILAPNWEKSAGCRDERELFISLGRKVLLYDDIMKNIV